jgi:hypothetical protein
MKPAFFRSPVVLAVSFFGAAFLALSAQAGDAPKPADLAVRTEAVYTSEDDVQTMKKDLVGEDVKVITHGILIHYMDDAEREASRVIPFAGKLWTNDGVVVPYTKKDKKLNYVMDPKVNFYVLNQKGHPELRHSSFLRGAPVSGAGNIQIDQGTIVKIDRNSGHYGPSEHQLGNVLHELKERGFDVSAFGDDKSAKKEADPDSAPLLN